MPLEKLTIQVIHSGERFKVKFNPEEYTINKDNNFAVQPIPGLSGPLVQFVNGNLRTLEMELFCDTWDTDSITKQDVRVQTGKILGLMDIDPDLHAPPLLNVSWASLQFRCVLARASQKYILFSDDGKPVRARLTVTFNEVVDPEQEAKQVSRQTADYTKLHVVVEGETLSAIAAHFYGDPTLWRPIALENGIADPRQTTTGQALLIPSLPYIDKLSREVVN